jgi:CheY-like chemotaxis protein
MARILIVEDNPVVQRMITHVVSRQGYETETAENGREALKKLSVEEFDLVITDAKMPELDGMGLIDAIRAVPEFSSLPIILITAHLDIYEGVSPEQLSAITLLTKPISSQDLAEALHKLLRPTDPMRKP